MQMGDAGVDQLYKTRWKAIECTKHYPEQQSNGQRCLQTLAKHVSLKTGERNKG